MIPPPTLSRQQFADGAQELLRRKADVGGGDLCRSLYEGWVWSEHPVSLQPGSGRLGWYLLTANRLSDTWYTFSVHLTSDSGHTAPSNPAGSTN